MSEYKPKVVKSNELINSYPKDVFSTIQSKLILTLISTIKKTDLSFEEKTIHIDDLPFFDSETRNNVYIDESCKEIMKKPIKINGFYYNWFIKIGYKNGFIHYQFHEDLVPYLLELKSNFTMYNLENVIKLNSNYSIKTYEIISQMVNWNIPKQTFFRTITFKELRLLMSLPESYKNNDIVRLLNKSQKDVSENTDLKFSFEVIKSGKVFDKITFVINKNKKE